MNTEFEVKQRVITFILIIAVAVFGITAFNSIGFLHADEHFQIIEFAGGKLGTHNKFELPGNTRHK